MLTSLQPGSLDLKGLPCSSCHACGAHVILNAEGTWSHKNVIVSDVGALDLGLQGLRLRPMDLWCAIPVLT